MVTFTKIYRTATEKWFVVGDCFSNDEKPIFDICQGSVLKEHDTGKKYEFDEENKLWAEVSADVLAYYIPHSCHSPAQLPQEQHNPIGFQAQGLLTL